MFNFDLGPFKKNSLILCLFVAVSFIVFLPTLFTTPFWDDWSILFKSIYGEIYAKTPWHYFPGGWATKSWFIFYAIIWGQFQFFKKKFIYYHLVSLFTHGINAFFIYKIFKKIQIKNSLLLAFLFLVHPVHLITVSWIIQQKTLFAIFFSGISILLYLVFFDTRKKKYYLFSLLFFFLSVFCKSIIAVAILPFLYYMHLSKILKKEVFYVLPFILLAFYSNFRSFITTKDEQLIKVNNIEKVFSIINPSKVPAEKMSLINKKDVSELEIIRKKELKNENIANTRKEYLQKNKNLDLGSLDEVGHYSNNRPVNTNNIQFQNINFFDRIILANRLVFRYSFYILFPAKSYMLFHSLSSQNYSVFELLMLFVGLTLILFMFLKFYLNEKRTLSFGIMFYLLSILPFIGLVHVPIFKISNFNPYWLSIPLIGFLLVFNDLIKNLKVLIFLIFIYAGVSHCYSYKFINTDLIIKDSIKEMQYPLINKVVLIEHYFQNNECQKARIEYDYLKNTELVDIFCLKMKIDKCEEINKKWNSYK